MKMASREKPIANFIEGMACVGGCVGGAGCLTHAEKNKVLVDRFANASGMVIGDAIKTADENEEL